MRAYKTGDARTRGRPKGPIKCRDPAAKRFFATCDRLGLSIQEIHKVLRGTSARAPSYRSLQDWRRGVREPRFPPFDLWRSIILKAVAHGLNAKGIQREAI
jgi:hypothetical protein